MKKVILAIVIAASLASCSDYGKKVKVDGTNTEIFYKGEGVTESDAKKTGDFLKKEFIQDNKKASIQITKEGEVYTLRFVYDKKVADTLKGLDDIFKLLAFNISKEVFGGKKVTVALADDGFKDFKTIPFDETIEKRLEAPSIDLSTYDHDTMDGVKFFWKGLSDDESKTIAEYIVKNGAFRGGHSEIYMTKEGDRYILKFPIMASARTDASYISEMERVSKEIKENAFANVPYSFVATDEQLNTFKQWDY